MNFSLSTLRGAGLFAALVVGASAATAAADLFPNYDSYIKITGKTADVKGNGSSFARRMQFPENGAWGIEALRVNKDINDATSLTVEGKALVGKEDYLGAFKLTKNEVGSFDMGYKRYRTFYDGIGGFFPLNNRWMQLANPELHTDRAKFWAEAKIERPNAPKFEFRYTNEQRTGRKDTTIWGDTDFTGIPTYYGVGASAINPGTNVAPYSTNRKIVPASIALNERQQNWLGSVKHTVGNTELEFEILHNTAKNNDKRDVVRYPGELAWTSAQAAVMQPSTTSPAAVKPPETIGNQVLGYDRQYFDSQNTTYTGKFETKFSEMVSVYGGLLYSKGDSDIGGDRQMVQYLRTATGDVAVVGGYTLTATSAGRPPYSYTTVAGNVDEKVLAANVGLKVKPAQDLFAAFSLKYEKQDVSGYNTTNYIQTGVNQTTGALTPSTIATPNTASRSEKSWIPEVEVRYTGIKGLALYGSFDYRHSPGTVDGSSTGVGPSGANIVPSTSVSSDNVKLNHAHYKAGANWIINPVVTVRGEIYYKDHTNGFTDRLTAGDGFVMGYEFFGQKISATVKPVANVSFTTRLVHQTGKMDVTVDSGTSIDSNDTKNYQFGETIDWAPSAQTFVQANLNLAYNVIQTSNPIAGGKANDVVRNADNNYRNGSLIAGVVADKDTDLTVEYTFYRADNYKVPNNATVWYGAGVKEYTFAAGVKHRFNDKLTGMIKLGYFNSKNETTGGNTNFKGPMAYVSFDHAL